MAKINLDMNPTKPQPRVLHVITGLNTGGAERALYNVLAGGISKQFDCAVISLSDRGTYGARLEELGVPVWSLDMPRGKPSLAGLKLFTRLVRGFQPNVVQGWMYHGNLAATLAKLLSGLPIPVFWNVRNSLYDVAFEKRGTRAIIKCGRFFSRQPNGIIYNSAVSRLQHESFGFKAGQGEVIPNGFDPARWKPDLQSRNAVRRELGITERTLLIGHVARYDPMKDHKMYLQALAKVAAYHPEVHFLFVGRDVDSSNPELAPLLTALPEGRLHTLGERDDIERLMSSLDIFCLSSWSEAFPNVLGEAMACGVPCVTTEVGDSGRVVGDTGIIVPARDPKAFAAGIARLLSMNAAERAAMGIAARERVRTSYSLDTTIAQYAKLYNQEL